MPGSGGGEEYHELREIKATEKFMLIGLMTVNISDVLYNFSHNSSI